MARQKHADANSLCCLEVDDISPIYQFIHHGLAVFFSLSSSLRKTNNNKKTKQNHPQNKIVRKKKKFHLVQVRKKNYLRYLLKMTFIVSE